MLAEIMRDVLESQLASFPQELACNKKGPVPEASDSAATPKIFANNTKLVADFVRIENFT